MQQSDENLRPFRFAIFVLFTGLITTTIIFLTRFLLAVWMEATYEPDVIEDVGKYLNFRIGDQAYVIPANMVEQTLPASEGEQKGRIDLALHWPSMLGRTEDNKLTFTDITRTAPVIHMMLRLHSDPVSISQRFERILLPAFTGGPIDAPNGLTGYRLAEGSGFGGEILYFDQSKGDARFTIRCDNKDTPAAPAECLRHIQLSPEIALEYRYRIGLLAEWPKIDAAILQLTQQLKR